MTVLHPVLILEPGLLAPGDQMSREEFLRRWEQMPDLKFAELIEGVVYMPSPVSRSHADFDSMIGGLLLYYATRVPGCRSSANATWLINPRNAPQPDLSLRKVKGRSRVEGKFAAGVPELVAEICVSSRSYDLGPKLALYQTTGVPEYLAALVEERRVEWRYLERGSYKLLKPHRDGTLRSRIFPGLWLNVEALWKEDAAGLIATLEKGLAPILRLK